MTLVRISAHTKTVETQISYTMTAETGRAMRTHVIGKYGVVQSIQIKPSLHQKYTEIILARSTPSVVMMH